MDGDEVIDPRCDKADVAAESSVETPRGSRVWASAIAAEHVSKLSHTVAVATEASIAPAKSVWIIVTIIYFAKRPASAARRKAVTAWLSHAAG